MVARSASLPAGRWLARAASGKIVEAHAGRIWLESGLGQGTTVFFTLPKD